MIIATALLDGEPVRLADFANDTFVEIASRSAARKAARRGDLQVDGSTVEGNPFLRVGQRVDLHEPTVRRAKVFRQYLPVIHEDEHLAVVHKPSGLIVNGNRYRTLQNSLPYNLKSTDQPDALAVFRPVHRLDRATSGLVLCAKTASAMVALGRAFEQRDVGKEYRAIVIGRLEEGGSVDTPIDGRDALTTYEVLGHSRSLKGKWLTTVRLTPHTGRTHQLRRHMLEKGTPILGDSLYFLPGLCLKGKGLFLCASGLAFCHPASGVRMEVAIDEPAKFAGMRAREDRRWAKYYPAALPISTT